MNKIIALIPARSGSKRLKNKNIKLINNKPLIYWSVYKALKSKLFDQVIFSSDSANYYKLLLKYLNKDKLDCKKLIFDKRSQEDSSSHKKIFDYVKDTFIKKLRLSKNDLLVLMLPTAPLRKIDTIKKIVKKSLQEKKDIFTASNFDTSVNYALKIINHSEWKPYLKKSPLINGNTRSQDQEVYLRPNPVCCCLWVKNLTNNKNSIFNNSTVYKTERLESLDIDTKEDFIIADLLMKNWLK